MLQLCKEVILVAGVYIHIPFCSKICSYCDFAKTLYIDAWADEYLKSLNNEIKLRYKKAPVTSLYIGGGTPSVLSINQLKTLFKICKIFKLKEDAEITIECNINDLTLEKLELFKKVGINRLSIGVETVNDRLLKTLSREHTKEDLTRIMKTARSLGFDNISFDYIYAIPGSNINDVKKDLVYLTSLKPDHFSAYSLIVEPHTELFVKKTLPVKEELDEAMYEYIRIYLKGKGYHQYEVSNYAKPGKGSVHNKIYWKNLPYYGFGLGAHSFLDHTRYANTKSLNKYIDKLYLVSKKELTKKEEMDETLMLGLRLREGINIKEFNNRFNTDLLANYDTSKCKIEDGFLRISRNKVYTMNSILNDLISWEDKTDERTDI